MKDNDDGEAAAVTICLPTKMGGKFFVRAKLIEASRDTHNHM